MQTSFRLNDFILVVVVISSMMIAIIFPDFGSRFQAFPFYSLMVNFFLSYLSIDLADVWKALKEHSRRILAFTVLKLAILPVIIYGIFYVVAPEYALAAMLLTGVSSGVVSPMISNMVKGNSSLVLVVVVITSVLAPFTLPALIKAVIAREVSISFWAMLKMLATVIFIPIILVEGIRYLLPRMVAPILKIQFPVSLLMFALINFGVFYRYAPFFRKAPSVIILATIVVFILAAVYCIAGIFFFPEGCAGKSACRRGHAGQYQQRAGHRFFIPVFRSRGTAGGCHVYDSFFRAHHSAALLQAQDVAQKSIVVNGRDRSPHNVQAVLSFISREQSF